MTTVILKSIDLENFKGIAKGQFTFNDKVNQIKAQNGEGKSSIKNAFEWVLCQNVVDVLPMLNNKEIPNLTTKVIANLEINGFEYKLQRVSKGKYQLNEETGKMNKITNENTYSIDDIEMKEKDYKEKLADILGIGAFENLQILTDKEYFNSDTTKFKWDDRRKILFEICGVDNAIKDIIEKEKYADIKDYVIKGYATSDIKSMLAKEKKGYKETQNKNNILIEQKTKEITELSGIDFEKVAEDLKTAKEKLNKILTSSQKENENEQINELQTKIFELNKQKSQLEMQDLNKQNELRKAQQDLYNECKNIDMQYDIEYDTMNELLGKLNNLNSPETECPLCHRPYEKDKIEKIQEEIDSQKEELSRQIETQQKLVTQLLEKHNAKKEEFDKAKAEFDSFEPNSQIKELNDGLISIQKALETAKATDLSNLSNEQQLALESEISSFERELGKKAFIENGKASIQSWKDENRDVADKIIEVEKKEKALTDYVKEQTDIIVEKVNEKFSNGISWALYKEIYKNGEGGIEEDCVCMYNGKRYSSLSAGQKNIANIETIKVLQDYYKLNIVMFSDNAESITLPYETNGQVIELFAEKGTKLENVIKIDDVYKKGE